MLGFAAGVLVGCIVGFAASLFFLQLANGTSDEIPTARRRSLPGWQLAAALMALMLLAAFLSRNLMPRRFVFLTLLLLLIIFAGAKLRGMVMALPLLAFAAVVMGYVLPPAGTIRVDSTMDRVLLFLFIVFGLVGSRLIENRRQEIL